MKDSKQDEMNEENLSLRNQSRQKWLSNNKTRRETGQRVDYEPLPILYSKVKKNHLLRVLEA
jgi:hypothetical protein